MHIADGFLEAPVLLTTAVASAGVVAWVAKAIPPSKLAAPMVGACAAFVLAAQMVNFPVASAVSGHLVGGVLVAALLGWRVSVLVMAAVLVIQAFLFQDGGITAVGANLLNLGILGPGMGYLVFLLVRGGAGSRSGHWGLRHALGAFLGGWVSSVVAAFFAGLELWLSGQGDPTTLITLLVGIHAIIGIAEGAATLLILRFLTNHRQQCAEHLQAPG